MTWRSAARVIVGLVLMLLGLLWALQGADLVRIEPILCVADCEPVTGGSTGWLIAGVASALIGLTVAAAPWRRRRGGRRGTRPQPSLGRP
ncbi:hypothetical protein LO763_09705 [Glycomyces sp. A-F 0318]|uniref:hypothetical protein n=1 Tax=Glycomyces amatae TaxID=2881355 RepID=UPI001E4CDA0A|nr:hypothetical protein [Glycomyces amatae]MCD0443899.1 hypothetical protein [Glycomyces amatae]